MPPGQGASELDPRRRAGGVADRSRDRGRAAEPRRRAGRSVARAGRPTARCSGGGPHPPATGGLRSCRCWGRPANRLRDTRSRGARDPDVSTVLPTVQVAASLVFRDKGHQGVENVRHGPGRLSRTLV